MVHAILINDTGSPYTNLSQNTFEKLGYRNNIPDNSIVNVHWINMNVYLSRNHLSHINVLGQDFSVCSRLRVQVSFEDFTLNSTEMCK